MPTSARRFPTDMKAKGATSLTAIRQLRRENCAQDSHESVRRARTLEADEGDFGAISDEPGAGGTEGRPFAFRVAIRR
jgi:hypothetical protein